MNSIYLARVLAASVITSANLIILYTTEAAVSGIARSIAHDWYIDLKENRGHAATRLWK
jgi:hypothetical protein